MLSSIVLSAVATTVVVAAVSAVVLCIRLSLLVLCTALVVKKRFGESNISYYMLSIPCCVF